MKLVLVILMTFLYGCSSNPFKVENQHHQMMATLWIQNAAEVKALDYQAFNAATKEVNRFIPGKKRPKPLAVIMDIDETVLDNSPYQAQMIEENADYDSKSWGEWIEKRTAMPLTGVVDFINHTQKRGVEVFLVSNRKIKYLEATYQNLVDKGINVKRENIFLRTTSSSKAQRRRHIEKRYRVILYVGDTLADFHDEFEKVSKKQRDLLVEKYRQEFGTKYIILPNPMYGDWIYSLYQYEHDLSESTKARIRKKHIYPYK